MGSVEAMEVAELLRRQRAQVLVAAISVTEARDRAPDNKVAD
jgi:hypothetical protein